MERTAIVISICGVAVALIFYGWRNALGFAGGTVIAYFNFGLWKQISGALGAPGASVPGGASAALLGLRYLLIGGAVFAMIKVLDVSAMPVVGGLLVSAAAVLIEIVRQLFGGGVNSSSQP
jgi:hypothetical protein